jgi:TonB family protein
LKLAPGSSLSPLAISLLLHAVAAFVLLTVKWDVDTVPPPAPARLITLLAPRPELPRPKPAPRRRVSPRPPLPASRAFRPTLPVLPPAAPALRLPEPAPVSEIVPQPILLASPDPLPPNLPPRPPAPVKLGNLTAAGTSEPAAATRAAVALGGAFGAAGAAEGSRSEPDKIKATLRGGFGDARVVKPVAAQTAVQSIAAMTPVEILSKPRPEYTDEARKLRIEGEVVLEVRFAASGQAQVLRLMRGLGHGLDESARRAALLIKFRPALKAGVPADSIAVVHILFQLAY